jgi:hypothetical protein
MRKLLEAFEPHQEARLAELDRQIEESNPDLILDQIFILENETYSCGSISSSHHLHLQSRMHLDRLTGPLLYILLSLSHSADML